MACYSSSSSSSCSTLCLSLKGLLSTSGFLISLLEVLGESVCASLDELHHEEGLRATSLPKRVNDDLTHSLSRFEAHLLAIFKHSHIQYTSSAACLLLVSYLLLLALASCIYPSHLLLACFIMMQYASQAMNGLITAGGWALISSPIGQMRPYLAVKGLRELRLKKREGW